MRPDLGWEPLGPESPWLEEATRLYREVWGREEQVSRWFMRLFLDYPDYHGYVRSREGRALALGFGTRSLPGQWWHDQVAAQIGAAHPGLQDAWVLVELSVDEAWRGQGLGRELMDRLLTEQPCPRVLLSTALSNFGAQRLYESEGWRILHPGFAFLEGGEPYRIYGRELG